MRNRIGTRNAPQELTGETIHAKLISTKRSQGITHKTTEYNMRKLTVQSTALASIGFNTDNTLEVRFNSGGTYRYFNVPQQTVEQLLSATSPGSFFAENISGQFRSRRVK